MLAATGIAQDIREVADMTIESIETELDLWVPGPHGGATTEELVRRPML